MDEISSILEENNIIEDIKLQFNYKITHKETILTLDALVKKYHNQHFVCVTVTKSCLQLYYFNITNWFHVGVIDIFLNSQLLLDLVVFTSFYNIMVAPLFISYYNELNFPEINIPFKINIYFSFRDDAINNLLKLLTFFQNTYINLIIKYNKDYQFEEVNNLLKDTKIEIIAWHET